MTPDDATPEGDEVGAPTLDRTGARVNVVSPSCICPPDYCLGTDSDSGMRVECVACLELDPELDCLAGARVHVVTDPACRHHDPARVDEARGRQCFACVPRFEDVVVVTCGDWHGPWVDDRCIDCGFLRDEATRNSRSSHFSPHESGGLT